MLRNRSRAVTSKQAMMTDHSSQSPSTRNETKTIQSFFGSPRFKSFSFKSSSEASEHVHTNSPTSILEPFSPFKNPFWCDRNQPRSPKISSENKHLWDKLDSIGIGVALIDDEVKPIDQINDNNSISKPTNKMVLFASKLRVQIPPTTSCMSSPGDFGIKTRNHSPFLGSGSGNQARESPRVFTGCISMSELELSEDYTCVITYGPNPKTTHIFEDCILNNYCSFSADEPKPVAPTKNFLSSCHTCNKNLEQKNDIFIYRGEKAFCSPECRYQEMLIDDIEN